jgi:hypothetical protein
MKKTVREASDTSILASKLTPIQRTPEQEKILQEKLDRLHAKYLRIKAQQAQGKN